MLLDALRDFTWYNEPHNVRFIEEGMIVEVAEQTDFWQSAAHIFIGITDTFFIRKKPEILLSR